MADWRRPGGWSGWSRHRGSWRPGPAGRCQRWQPGEDILTKLTSQGVGALHLQCQPGVVLPTVDKVPAIMLTWQVLKLLCCLLDCWQGVDKTGQGGLLSLLVARYGGVAIKDVRVQIISAPCSCHCSAELICHLQTPASLHLDSGY